MIRKTMLTLVLVSLVAFAPLWGAGASLEAKGSEIELGGYAPGHEVAVFGVMRQHMVYTNRVIRVDRRLVMDAAGSAALSIPDLGIPLLDEVPLRSVFIAVDLETGEHAMTAPEGFDLVERAFPYDSIELGAAGADRFTYPRPRVEAFRVQPGVGAWRGSAVDGSGADHGPTDGAVTFSVDELEAIGDDASAAPAQLGEQEILVVVNTDNLEISVAMLGERGVR